MDDDLPILFPIFVLAFFLGLGLGLFVVGPRDFQANFQSKPCNQFTLWQYQQRQVPARCVK